jgi:hypothetical protein
LRVSISAGVKEAFCVHEGSTENRTGIPSTGCPCASRTRTTSTAASGKLGLGKPIQISVSEMCKDTLYPCSESNAVCCGAQAVLPHRSRQQRHTAGTDRTMRFLSPRTSTPTTVASLIALHHAQFFGHGTHGRGVDHRPGPVCVRHTSASTPSTHRRIVIQGRSAT